MLRKEYATDKELCTVTFELHSEVLAQSAYLCGDFNNWDRLSHPMNANDDGSFTLTLNLETGRLYRFRYLLDDSRWQNDRDADGYEPNPFGSDDSILDLTLGNDDGE